MWKLYYTAFIIYINAYLSSFPPVFLPGMAVVPFLVLLNVIMCSASAYLLYILFFVMQKVCLVCIGIYLVNSGLLVCSVLRFMRQRGNMSVANSNKKRA